VTEAEWPSLRLESDRVQLDLGFAQSHGARPRLSATVMEAGDEETYSAEGAQRLLQGTDPDPNATLLGDDPERAVRALAGNLRAIEPLLQGHPDAFATLRRREREALAGIQLEDDLRVARPEAKEAFQARDWARVIALLDPLEGHLERHEQRWLDYARRRSGA
jgi:hypothetical protein